ncbi:MAG: molybdopterin-dependent oxidoreductase [Planctomycetota bacterium]
MSVTRHRPCHLCEASCGLVLEVEGERIVSVRNDPQDPFSRGFCCPKGLAVGELHHDPDRLRRPLVRRGGELVEASWPEALEAAAEGLAGVVRRHGLDGLGVYVGNPTVHALGAALGTEVWRRVLPTRNRYSANSQDVNPHLLVNYLTFGMQLSQPVPDLERTRFLLVVGANPVVSGGSLLTAPGVGRRLKEVTARGGKVVVLDPRRSETARLASEHVFVWPDKDALLLLSLARAIVRAGRWDEAFLARWARPGWKEALPRLLEPFDPERVAPRAGPGLTAGTIERLARELSEAEGAAVYARLGPCNAEHGGLAVWATTLLNAITGNLDRPGGSLFPEGPGSWLFRAGAAHGSYARYRSPQGAPELGGEYPCWVLADQIERGLADTAAREAVFGLVTFAGNPALSVPNGPRLRAALSRLEFLVSLDIYPSETARLAHVVLPARSSLCEPHFDPIAPHFATADVTRYGEPVVSPPPDAPAEYDLITGLAREVARRAGLGLGQRLLARALPALANPRRVAGPIVRFGPRGAGLNPFGRGWTLAKLRAAPHGLPPEPLQPGRLRARIGHRDGRLDLLPGPIVADLARAQALLEAPPPAPSELRLIGRRQLKSNNSWFHNLERLQGGQRCTLLVHPQDAAALNLDAGDAALLRSRVGELEVEVQTSEEVARGVVSLPHGWGHQEHGGRVASARPGVSINDVTDDARYDPLTGNSALNGVAVTLAPVPAAVPAGGAPG